MLKSYLNSTRTYVLSILTTRTPVENFYHDVIHTNDVVQSVIEIGIGEKLSEDELEMIQIAAWFHDVGYIEKTDGHEKVSVEYARKFLTELQYPSNKIEIIIGAIFATKVPQRPKNKFEKILCDADLFHLGKETFFDRNDKYRVEYENHLGHKLSERDWLVKTIDFVKDQSFYTGYAKRNFTDQKNENLRLLNEQLQRITNNTD
ncbi:MAG: HD domain-containing protein [Ignavibacteriales bacterium]|nr:HD domain-containing protein [Ignavibacteriales bacterium]